MYNEHSMFEDDDIMVFPESIDNIEASKSNYLFSTTKLIFMFLGILPAVVLGLVLLSDFGFIPFIVFIVLYLIVYLFLVRVYVIEEPRQRESLIQLEDNKYSDYSYFWDISKVGTSPTDDGLLYLRQDGVSLKRAYVVMYDSGSIVGVSDDFLREFRSTLQEFLRSLRMDIKWYSIQKKAEISKALENQSSHLISGQNEALNKLIKIQLNNYIRYSDEAEQRYVNYFLIINKDFEKLSTFKESLEDSLNRTLRTNSSFKNVKILNSDEMSTFFATYYMQNKKPISTIRKTQNTLPFSNYARVVAVRDKDGYSVPMEFIDIINAEFAKSNGGLSVDNIEESLLRESNSIEKSRIAEFNREKNLLLTRRTNEEITFEEYKERLIQINHDYSAENYIPNRKAKEKEEEKQRKIQERKLARIEEKQRKEEEARLAQLPEEKWYEKDDFEFEKETTLSTETFEEDNTVFDNLKALEKDYSEEEEDLTVDDLIEESDENPETEESSLDIFDLFDDEEK